MCDKKKKLLKQLKELREQILGDKITLDKAYNVLFEMSTPRDVLLDKIKHYEPVITENIIYLITFPNTYDFEHWKKEAIAAIAKISGVKIKQSNRYLEKELYFKGLYIDFADNDPDDLMRMILNAIQDKPKDYSIYSEQPIEYVTIFNVLFRFYTELSTKLSQGPVPRIELKQLLDKYFDK